MDSVLIVSSTSKGQKYFSDFLNAHEFNRIGIAASGGEARRILLEMPYDLVVINAPLRDEFGHELAIDLSNTTSAGVLMVVKSELADSVSLRVEDEGVIVVSKPINRTIFYQSLRLSLIANKRLVILQKENSRLQKKVNELREVGRAKCALVQYRHLTEQEAHHFIEKQAMDQRLSVLDIAEDILRTYEG